MAHTLVSADGPQSVPALLHRNAKQFANAPAYREKEYGIWQSWTWAQTRDEVEALALGLLELGANEGDFIAIIGRNRPYLYWAMMAAEMVGAVPVPLYQDANAEEMAYVLDHCGARFVIAGDQEQVDKVLDVQDQLTQFERMIYLDPRGMRKYDHAALDQYSAVQDMGRKARDKHIKELEARQDKLDYDSTGVMLYTSGTTGKPKGVVLSNRNIIETAKSSSAFDKLRQTDDILAYLPMAWVGDFAITVGAALLWRFTVNVPERQETVVRDMREIAPTFYLAAPRSWDQMLTTIQVGMENSTPFKKWLYHFFMDRAVAAETRKLNGKSGGALEPLGRFLGEALVFGPIKDQFGMSRLKNAFTGGEAIGEDTFVFYRALGIKLRQLYGQTENSAINAIQAPGEVRLHTVGKPAPGVELKIADDGEILMRSDSVFEGYFNKPEATAEALEDGWLHTGDAGYIEDDGHLVVLGRVSEVMHTAGGERYVPNYIENRLKFSPYIKDAAVLGAGLDELTAMVCVDFEAVGHWAEVNGVPYVSYADLSQRDEVAKLLHEAFLRVNKALTEPLRLQRFVSLPKEFDPDDGEITRTRKLRRKVVQERYADVVAALYDGSKEVHVSAQVTYETGEVGKVEKSLPIREV